MNVNEENYECEVNDNGKHKNIINNEVLEKKEIIKVSPRQDSNEPNRFIFKSNKK